MEMSASSALRYELRSIHPGIATRQKCEINVPVLDTPGKVTLGRRPGRPRPGIRARGWQETPVGPRLPDLGPKTDGGEGPVESVCCVLHGYRSDVRCGAKPCPDSHSCAGLVFSWLKIGFIWCVSLGGIRSRDKRKPEREREREKEGKKREKQEKASSLSGP